MIKLYNLLPLLLICISAYSQNPVQVFTPNAAGLGQYGQIPVNYFNGLPEISIPLTTFKAKGYELPISLSYHASGNNPDSHPGWVGLGWSLRAGGMINRIINGYKDEKSNSEISYLSNVGFGDNQLAYYYNSEKIQNSNWSDNACLSEINTNIFFSNDTEPDEFQINVDDIQASFYIVGKNKIKIKSKTNANFKVDIKLNAEDSDLVLYKNTKSRKDMVSKLFTYISEIIITKDDGTKYYFGGDMSAIEFSCIQYVHYEFDNTNNPRYWKSIGTANSWLLKKIELTNGEIVEFDYEKDGTPIIMSDSHYGEAYVLDGDNQHESILFNTRQKMDKYYNIFFTFIQPSYLKSINSKVINNKILFNRNRTNELKYDITKKIFEFRVGDFCDYDPLNSNEFSYERLMERNYYMQLDEIIENNKRIKFNYSNDSQSRLHLQSIALLNNNGGEISRYSLSYNGLKLPPYNSKKTDKWGYYNNKYYGDVDYEKLDSYRTPDEKYMQAEILTGITYPTGGKSEFIYEAHRYSRIAKQFDFVLQNSSGAAGGLRIKEIKTTEKGNVSTRKFEYTDSLGKSSGILSGTPLYYVNGRQSVNSHYSSWWGLVYFSATIKYKATYYIMQENHFNQLSTTNGNHVTYSRISEKLPDGSRIVYNYSNHEHYMDESPVKMLDNINSEVLSNSFISKELERGLLLKKEYINSTGVSLRTEINRYNASPDRYNDFLKSINQVILIGGNIQRNSALKIYTFYPYLESKTIIMRDSLSGRQLKTLTKYEYNANKLISKTSTSNSKGENEFEVISYSGDIKNGVYKHMQNKNMLNFPIEKTLVRNNHVVRSELLTYRENESNGDYVPYILYKAKLKIPLLYSQFVQFNGYSKDKHYDSPEIEYKRYDQNSNITEFVKKDSNPHTCIWGYNGEYPIGIFENAKNNYKITPRYEDYRGSAYVALKPNESNKKTYRFYSSQNGIVEINLSGALSYNWRIYGNLDGHYFSLVTMRSMADAGLPWTNYRNAYKGKVEIVVPKGSHRLTIDGTEIYKDKYAGEYDGSFTYTYWAKKHIEPDITGNNDVLYQNFENGYSYYDVPFGFHSSKSYVGAYDVELPTNPNRKYKIDYQVYKNGRWDYKCDDFKNGIYKIDEGKNPIDEIRVYPKDASVSTYTYFPFIGLRSKTDERGITESYEYDILGRLKTIKDVNNDIKQAFKYKYYTQVSDISPQKYYSIEQRRVYTKNDCDSLRGELGKQIEYIVPSGKYHSSISQEDANKKAYKDLIEKGQQYANENCGCSSNIVVSVYNPINITFTIECVWGPQGSIKSDFYSIPSCEIIGNSGDMFKDLKPHKIYIPRRNYRYIGAYYQADRKQDINLSIKSSKYNFGIFYSKDFYSGHEDTYVIGGYPFEE